MSVVNKEDKKVGDVNNLIVDLPMNRIVHMVISSGGFLGVGDALNAVPPSALRYNASGDALVLNLSKEELTRAPSFKSSEWPEFRDPTYSAKVYRSYGVDPYFSTDADNTARNVRDRQENRLTPLDQGTTDADVEMTRRIRKEILDRDGLSVNARNVKIITVNGRVTVRGPVNDEAEKQIIAEIVNRIAQSANVDNQTEVKREP
jgi:hyperosmotically inducible periplasmic protein